VKQGPPISSWRVGGHGSPFFGADPDDQDLWSQEGIRVGSEGGSNAGISQKELSISIVEDERLFGRSEILVDAEPNRPKAHECVKGNDHRTFIGKADGNHVVLPDAERR
jgi:hypothetical protein